MPACDDLVAFVDGELSGDEAEAFRRHLDVCEACREALVEVVQMDARLSMLATSASSPEDP